MFFIFENITHNGLFNALPPALLEMCRAYVWNVFETSDHVHKQTEQSAAHARPVATPHSADALSPPSFSVHSHIGRAL